MKFVAELQRRNVHRAAVFYAGAAWLLVQIATQVFPFFHVDDSVVRWIVIVTVAGFPFAMLFSWIYEWTPQGIKRESEIDRSESVTRQTGKTLDRAIIAVLSLAVVLLLVDKFVLRKPASGSADRADDKSIAVLPFENLSRDPDNAYFASGMQDEILTRLSKIGSLKVISRTSTMRFASSPDNLPEIAKLLGVAAILEGSVQKAGETVHVNVQLIRAATDEHLWAESYNRKLDDVFAVQGEVAQAVAEALRATLTGAEREQLAARPTSNTKAYEFYLRGLALEGRFTYAKDDLIKRADAYQSAVDLDPQFAQAWAGLTEAHTELYFNSDGTAQRLDMAKRALEQAQRLAPDASETWEALGVYRYLGIKDYDAAYEAISNALRTRPNDGLLVYLLGNIRRRQGHWDEAAVLHARATTLDPLATNTWFNLGLTLRALRRYDEAQTAFDRGLAAAPGDPELLSEKIITFSAVGNLDAAQKLVDTLPPGNYVETGIRNAVADLMRLRRDYAGFLPFGEKWLEDRAKQDPWTVATTLGAMGEAELLKGDRASGLAHLTESRSLIETLIREGESNPFVLAQLSLVMALLGDRDASYRESDLAAEKLANDSIGLTQSLEAQAFTRMLGGDKAQAIAYLQKRQALPIVYGDTPTMLKLDPGWDPLRDEPGFQALTAEGESGIKLQTSP